jgi:asparagine synthase (glutamine-hydrolysing)
MCGIFALFGIKYNILSSISKDEILQEFYKGKSRGPESSKYLYNENHDIFLGFHRLAINGLDEQSNQPFNIDGIQLICNGEIYNYRDLYNMMDVKPTTHSDCEVIIHLYKKYGIEQAVKMLDGVYAFVLYNSNTGEICIARDPFGVRPLYYLTLLQEDDTIVRGFSSELKTLNSLSNEDDHVRQFPPGLCVLYANENDNTDEYNYDVCTKFELPLSRSCLSTINASYIKLNYIQEQIRILLTEAVHKRCITTERPIACLLSGGLDSSLIASLVNQYYKSQGKVLETYSIGLQDSEDLKFASIVAKYLGTKHTTVIVTEEEMFQAIPEVIYAIESYDTTTVRASIGNYLIGKYIKENSDAKVIFNGDGSDELCGGYLYMGKCPDSIEFDKETRRLLENIYLYDVLRSDKCISSHGLEPRTPYLDRSFVSYYLSIHPTIRFHKSFENQCEKYLLRSSFIGNYLPDSILWRRKEAFSDGVSSKGRSLYQILQDKIANLLGVESSIESEKAYYKQLFDKYYPNASDILPGFWMPKYTNTTDPSARTLENYEESTTNITNDNYIIINK